MPKMPDISAILGEQLRDVPNLGTEGELRELPVEDVHPNPGNFYPPIDHDAMEDLQESIQANGVLEPLLVVRDGDGYRLISGHNRLQAVRHLRLCGPDAQRWAKVPCRILPPMDKLREQTAIIEANRQRKKTPQVLQQEAEELTRLYTERKRAGEELPGRIRDRVARDLEISAARASRLAAIKTGLRIPGFQRMWKDGDIGESVAYEISKLDMDQQYRLLDYHIDNHRPLTIPTVRRFCVIYNKLCKGACQVTGRACEIADQQYDAFFRGGEWTGCAGCCRGCKARSNCRIVCEYCKPEEEAKEEASPVNTEAAKAAENFVFCAEWHTNDVRPEPGTEIVFIDDAGIADIDVYREDGVLKDTATLWSEVISWTLSPLHPAADACQDLPSPAWQELDEHWPDYGTALLLCRTNGLGRYEYQPAVCVNCESNATPFVSPGDDIHIEDWDSYRWWLPFQPKD